MSKSRGARGKKAEGRMQTYLERVDAQTVNWDFERISDARSAGGRGAKKVVGDFSFFSPSMHGVIEVKETKLEHRLPASNVTQLPKLKKRILAGGHCYLLVYHTELDKWRFLNVEDMELRSTGSWNLRDVPLHDTLEQALPRSLLGVTNA